MAPALSLEQERHARLTRAAALAMGDWLIGSNLCQKRVGDLRIEEMEAMATAALSRFLVLASEEAAREQHRWPIEAYLMV